MVAYQSEDEKFMRLALEQAAKANPSPNPRVGAVIVKNGQLIAKGYHAEAGMPHAEMEAMDKLSPDQLRGSTLYVTLEPCSHYGRTPPCTDAIIKHKITRVVFGAHDANPKVKGEEILLHAGIDVVGGVLESESRKLNKYFFFSMENSRPFVVLKWAMSADGKIATKTGDSKWITSETARARSRQIRSSCDAVLVGVGTILADDPALGGPKRRIILDSMLRTPPNSKIFSTGNVIIICNSSADKKKSAALEKSGGKIIALKQMTVKSILSALHKAEIRSLFVEGGGETHATFVEANLFDCIAIYFSPKIVGGRDAKSPVGGIGISSMAKAKQLQITSVAKIGNEVEIVLEKEK